MFDLFFLVSVSSVVVRWFLVVVHMCVKLEFYFQSLMGKVKIKPFRFLARFNCCLSLFFLLFLFCFLWYENAIILSPSTRIMGGNSTMHPDTKLLYRL